MAEAPAQPNGIKIGDGRLHASLTVTAKYDSAAGYFGPTAQQGGDIAITPTAGLLFALDTPSTSVNANGSAGYVWYTGLLNSGSKDVSHFEASVGLNTAFNKTGAVEVDIGDQFTRSDRTSNTAAGIGLLSLYNSVSLAVPIHPGGGAIEVTPKVRWDVEFFSALLPGRLPSCAAGDFSCDPNAASGMNYSNLNFGLGAKWKFLPKTAAVLDASFDYRTYFNAQSSTVGASTNLPSMLLRVQGGLSGLITSRISTLVLVGGAGDFAASSAKTFICQAEVAYLGAEFTVRGGYLRTLNPIPILGAAGDDRGYVELRSLFFGRLGIRVGGAFDYLTYYAGPPRGDYVISANAAINYQFVSIFSAGISYTFSMRGSSLTAQGLNYQRHEPMLTLTLSY